MVTNPPSRSGPNVDGLSVNPPHENPQSAPTINQLLSSDPYVGLVNQQASQVPPHLTTSFVRFKVYKKHALGHALVDSGNLSYSLLSKEFADSIGVPLSPTSIQLKAANGTNMSVHGLAKEDVQIFLEGIASPLQIRPLIVSDLAFPLNLGHADLCRNQICVDFSMTPSLEGSRTTHCTVLSRKESSFPKH